MATCMMYDVKVLLVRTNFAGFFTRGSLKSRSHKVSITFPVTTLLFRNSYVSMHKSLFCVCVAIGHIPSNMGQPVLGGALFGLWYPPVGP